MAKRSVAKVIVDLTGDDGRLEAARERARSALDHGVEWGALAKRVDALEAQLAARPLYADTVELPPLADGIPPLELEEVRRVLGASEGETTLAAAKRATDPEENGMELWRERVAFLDGRVKALQEELTKLRRSRAVERAGPPTPRVDFKDTAGPDRITDPNHVEAGGEAVAGRFVVQPVWHEGTIHEGWEVWDRERGKRANAWLLADHEGLTTVEAKAFADRHAAALNREDS